MLSFQTKNIFFKASSMFRSYLLRCFCNEKFELNYALVIISRKKIFSSEFHDVSVKTFLQGKVLSLVMRSPEMIV